MNPTVAKNERDALRIRGGFQRNVIYALIGLASLQAFGSNYASKDYLGDMANYVLQQILTVSADSVDFQNKVILKMTDPDAYGKLKAELDAAALRIRKDRISTVWTARKEIISEQAKSVRVSGSLKTYIADVLTSTRDKEYIVDFYITSSGRLYVANVQEVVKPDPAASRPSR